MVKHLNIRLLVILMFVYGWISVNIYLPALPSLGHYFHTDESNLKLSITLFLIGFAVSQLYWGPISEKYGRKKPLLWGMTLVLIGTLVTTVASNIFLFNAGRVVEALGLGVSPVLGRAVLTDVLDRAALTSIMSYATISVNLMPAFAPIVGGYLLHWFGWRSIFIFLLLYGVILFFYFWRHLPETHPKIQPQLELKNFIKQYQEALIHRKFLGYLFPYILVSGAMIGYYAATPFIFVNKLHLAPRNYSFLSLFTVFTYISGAAMNQYLSRFMKSKHIVLLSIGILFLASMTILTFAFTGWFSILSIILPLSIFTFAAGIICPTANAAAMDVLREKAGIANAIIGSSIYASSSILSTIATALPLITLLPLAMYVSVITLITFFEFLFLVVF